MFEPEHLTPCVYKDVWNNSSSASQQAQQSQQSQQNIVPSYYAMGSSTVGK